MIQWSKAVAHDGCKGENTRSSKCGRFVIVRIPDDSRSASYFAEVDGCPRLGAFASLAAARLYCAAVASGAEAAPKPVKSKLESKRVQTEITIAKQKAGGNLAASLEYAIRAASSPIALIQPHTLHARLRAVAAIGSELCLESSASESESAPSDGSESERSEASAVDDLIEAKANADSNAAAWSEMSRKLAARIGGCSESSASESSASERRYTIPVYEALASAIVARKNIAECAARGTATSVNWEWHARHCAAIDRILESAPSGSGIDSGTGLSDGSSERLVLTCSFHHMDPESGMYDGWTDHVIRVRGGLASRLTISISGRDRNGVKEYLHEVYSDWLVSNVDTRDLYPPPSGSGESSEQAPLGGEQASETGEPSGGADASLSEADSAIMAGPVCPVGHGRDLRSEPWATKCNVCDRLAVSAEQVEVSSC
jgi:hypothetical protein